MEELKCQYPQCKNKPKKKCTKCGKLFCELHLRYGNPRLAFGSLQSSIGNYCDDCWMLLEKQGRLERILVPLIGGLTMIIIALAIRWLLF
ncbi:hypothetical protein [Anaerolinea thermophila]|uniref:hypothetical protein n=1 Tax=Anaerolinea thermophila TaxID=167964 RepID=UPI0026ED49EC|nr:hypothetical protein [Anaerolinea thermophila]